MNYKYIYAPIALNEYKDAVEWYNKRSNIAAENFVKDVQEKIKNICSHPFRYRNTYKYFRETSLMKYPFCIVYFVEERKNTIVISSIYHQKRNPKRKYKK